MDDLSTFEVSSLLQLFVYSKIIFQWQPKAFVFIFGTIISPTLLAALGIAQVQARVPPLWGRDELCWEQGQAGCARTKDSQESPSKSKPHPFCNAFSLV